VRAVAEVEDVPPPKEDADRPNEQLNRANTDAPAVSEAAAPVIKPRALEPRQRVKQPVARPPPVATSVAPSVVDKSPTSGRQIPTKNGFQEDGYHIGAAVEVWSKTYERWFFGNIVQMEGKYLLIEFVATDGYEKEKWMPIGHPDLKLQDPPLQASTYGSGMNPITDNQRRPANGGYVQTPYKNQVTMLGNEQKTKSYVVGAGAEYVTANGNRYTANGNLYTGNDHQCKKPYVVGGAMDYLAKSDGRRYAGNKQEFKYSIGAAVEYHAKSDGCWYSGVINTMDDSGYMLMLDCGIAKKVAMQDVLTRVRPLAGFTQGGSVL
jgi:hypothetical protein